MNDHCINSAIALSLVECEHPDLSSPIVTQSLAAEAADILAQLLYCQGYRLDDHYVEGVLVSQSFRAANGDRLDDVTTTLMMLPDDRGHQTLRLAVRANLTTVVHSAANASVFSGSARVGGLWFSVVQMGVSVVELLRELKETQDMRLVEQPLVTPIRWHTPIRDSSYPLHGRGAQ